MAHQSQSSWTGVPLGDLTNTYQRGDTVRHGEPRELEDSEARKNQRQRERYAAMSREKKEEKNRMQRERRMKKKAQAIDVSVSMHEDEENEWLHRGHLTGNSYVPAGGEVLSNAETNGDGIDESYIDTTQDNGTQDGSKILAGAETNEEGIECTNADSAGGNILTGAGTNEDGIECTIADRGAADETTPVNEQILSPGERRRRKDRARRAAMSPLQREALNKRRRDARAAKRLFKTPQEKKETRRQTNLNYRRRTIEQRANNLHPDSIAMANPQFKPELLFPSGDKPPSRLSEEMEIPDFGGTPVYVEADVQQPPQEVETPETFLSNTIHTSHLTPGLRHSRRKRRNQEFEATIERNVKGTTDEHESIASQLTQSCVVDNGVTQNYPRGDGTSDAYGAGTSGHAPHNEKCTQTQPSVVDEHESVPPRNLHGDPREDGDDNIVFDDDDEPEEGFLFAGQEDDDDDDVVVDVDHARGDEDNNEPDAPDPFGAVYGNVPAEGHTLKPVDNCEFCNAKKFEYEPPGFCCRGGAIHLSPP